MLLSFVSGLPVISKQSQPSFKNKEDTGLFLFCEVVAEAGEKANHLTLACMPYTRSRQLPQPGVEPGSLFSRKK